MGGYLAARWGEKNPANVHKMFLMCPSFDLLTRWPTLLGEAELRRWEKEGELVCTPEIPYDSLI